jgi:hypothetical protein
MNTGTFKMETMFGKILMAHWLSTSSRPKKGCGSHYGVAIYIRKYLKAKEELWKLKYFTMQKHNLQKNL